MKMSIYKSMGIIFVTAAMVMCCGQKQIVAQTHAGNVTIDGSLAVGTDTVSPTNFGFDTIRLRENNLRIHFDDTSVAAAFPRNDWRIVINDSANGGSSYFGIQDATAGVIPFRVSAGARNHALFVDSQGDVGIGTSTPATDLDIKIGDTPTVRLQQDNTSGFTPQTWDVAGNEGNFFIRDATGGSTLPFRIRPGAPTSSIDIAGSGNVGVGTGAPNASLHVRRTNGTAMVLVEETGTRGPVNRDLLELRNNGGVRLLLTNSNVPGNPGKWQVSSDPNGEFIVTQPGTGGAELILDNNGDMTIRGMLTELSDRAAKENIREVDGDEILEKVTALPVSVWSYKNDKDSARHMGPMAQDFRAAFNLGDSDKTISPSDKIGVSMVAIKALHEKLIKKDADIRELELRLQKLEEVIDKLTNE